MNLRQLRTGLLAAACALTGAVATAPAAHASVSPLDQGSAGVAGGWASDQWNLGPRPGGIRVARAWDRLVAAGAPGGFGTTIALIDTGVAYRDAQGYGALPDVLGTQFVPGIDLVDDDADPLDPNGHGTHIAATIGEQLTLGQPAGQPDYLTGIAYGARLMPVRVLDEQGVGTTDDVASGITWAARNGADVINIALNFDSTVTRCTQVRTVCRAIRKANRLGAFVVASAGNADMGTGRNRALFPAGAPGAFAVGATTEHGCLADYSHYGTGTDLLAPGGGLPRPAAEHPACHADTNPVLSLSYSCFPLDCAGGRTRFAIRPDTGTSMSAAHVSAVAALVIASGVLGPDPTPAEIAARLQCTARAGKPKRFYEPGLLDAQRAVDPRRDCDR